MRLKNRKLPAYSKNEETVNMVTHIIGAVFALISLILCVTCAAWNKNNAGVVSGLIYGISMVTVYIVSSIYHGLDESRAFIGKRVMQVIDHCDIYGLIIGTFSPIFLCGLVKTHSIPAYISYGTVLITCIVGIVFTAIDFHRFKWVSYSLYFVSGWSVLITVKAMYDTFGTKFLVLLLTGGVVYTLGMIFYVLETKHYRYCHSVFHLFILGGSILQFIPILKYCMIG